MLELIDVHIALAGPHERLLVRQLSAQVRAGEVLAVMGESGSGKSSLLAFLCGTLPAGLQARGEVRLAGRDITHLPTVERRVGILFQDDLLFPHMSVLDNLLFALPAGDAQARGVDAGGTNASGAQAHRVNDRVAQAEAALADTDLAGFGARFPHTLSGGQRARVSVLRALLAQPRALLLDEPFSRLDAALRERFRAFVFERLRAQSIPAVLVTHDPQDVPAGAQVLRLAAPSPQPSPPGTGAREPASTPSSSSGGASTPSPAGGRGLG